MIMRKLSISLILVVGLSACVFASGWTRVGGMALDYGWTPPAAPPGPVCAFCNITPDEDGFITYGDYTFHQAGGLRYGILSVSNSIGSNNAYITQTIPGSEMNPANGGLGNMGAQHGWYALPRDGATGIWVEFSYGTGEVDRYEFGANDTWQMLYANVTPNSVAEGGGGPMTEVTIKIGILKDPAATTGTRTLMVEDFLMWVPNLPLTAGGHAQWDNYLFDLKPDWRENLIVLKPSSNPLQVDEYGPASTTYDVVCTDDYYGNWPPFADVTVTITPDSQTEINGAGAGVPVDLTITEPNYSIPQTVTVTAVVDMLVEGDHTSTITHSVNSDDPDYDQSIVPPLTVNVKDNNTPGYVVTPLTLAVAEEGETTAAYTVRLTGVPTATVTVTATRSSPDVTLDAGSGPSAQVNLIFTTGNYATPQTVTVKAIDDSLSEGPEAVTITQSSASSDTNYNGLSIDNVLVNVAENEPYCGEPGQPYPDFDLAGPDGIGLAYRDCRVDIYELAAIASQWLNCTDRFYAECVQW